MPIRFRAAAGRDARPDARANAPGLALLFARGAARAALWLPSARTVCARAGPSLQPEQAVARSVREVDSRRAQVEQSAFRLSDRQPASGSLVRPAQQRSPDASLRGDRSRVQLGRRSAAAHAVGRDRDLRAARERFHARPPGDRRSTSAGPTPVSRASPRSTTCAASASRRSSSCRSTPSSTTGISSSAASRTTGATTPSASSRPRRAMRRRGT